MIAAVLVHPAFSISLGILALIGLWWHWATLAQPSIPVSRRRIRRITTMLILAAIPLLVTAMSIIDRQTHPREFVIAWSLVFVLMLLIILAAALDVLNSLWLHQKDLERDAIDAAKDLAEALKKRQRDSDGDDQS